MLEDLVSVFNYGEYAWIRMVQDRSNIGVVKEDLRLKKYKILNQILIDQGKPYGENKRLNWRIN